ncbi:MAG: hypothetical protein HYR60_12805 [Acidobacteria bacterium]|nr:hypothetical protein [Acidobacteriota bacterium]
MRNVTSFTLVLSLWLLPVNSAGQTNILTQHNNPQRTGANTGETRLTTQNVKSGDFGKLWEYPVRGRIYAQPLYVTIDRPGPNPVTHMVIVATAENWVYAFSADSNSPAPLWRFDAGSANVALAARVYLDDGGQKHGQDITPTVGIIGTPVIDLENLTMYFVAMTQETGQDRFAHTLHAIDITNGVSKGRQLITGSVEGGGTFNSHRQNQRAALALVKDPALGDRVYVAWSGFGDIRPYDGFVMSYGTMNSPNPLKKLAQFQVARFNPTLGSRHKRGGIWHSGGGPAIDDRGNALYVVTGDGDSRNNHAGRDFDSSTVRLDLGLRVQDYYTPSYQNFLNENDLDLSVAGPMIPEDQPDAQGRPVKLLVHAGKAGIVYVLNRDRLGRFHEHSNDIIQELQAFPTADDLEHQMEPSHIHTTPVYWRAPDGGRVYVASDYNLGIRAHLFQNEKLGTLPVASNFFPRAPISQMSLSSNGSQAGTGILWAISSPTGLVATYPGILYAFDAETLEMIYSSETHPFDRLGDYPRFNAPTIADGKAFVPTFTNKLVVYGLCSRAPANTCRCNVCP